jgi:tetratricopeptide (TPR) repeat protein
MPRAAQRMLELWRRCGGRDARLRALAVTLLAIAAGGIALAWINGKFGPPAAASRPDARSDPSAHAAFQQKSEVDARFAQGVVMLHARRYDHAVTAFHRVLELAPGLPEAHVNMGYALIGLERYQAAHDFFESATALNRNQVNAYYGLAVALEGLHDLAGAVGAMRTFVHRARQDDPYRRKAEAALWEWEAELARRRSAAPEKGAEGAKGGR